MGTVKVDTTEKHRKYADTYALDAVKGVEKLLRDQCKLAARRFAGDYAASDIIIDLNEAIERARLSRRQAETLTFLYERDLSKVDTAVEMDVTPQAVANLNGAACRKIAQIFQDWNYGEVDVVREKFDYVELFSGIGGFRSALDALGRRCVFASEIDRFATRSYQALYNGAPELRGDITQMDTRFIPDHELLVAGFPCQAFSMAGQRRGFDDTRGTLFFEIARIAKEKRPKMVLLENVKGLLSHDKGRTFDLMAQTLTDIGYALDFTILNSKFFGVPQNRERVFIVAHRDVAHEAWETRGNSVIPRTKRRIQALGVRTFNFDWPANDTVTMRLRDVLESEVPEKYYMSEGKTATLIERFRQNKDGGDVDMIGHLEGVSGHDINKRVYSSMGLSPTLPTAVTPKITIPYDDGYDELKVNRIGSIVPSGRGTNGSVYIDNGLSPTLTTNDGGGVRVLTNRRKHRIRRLTPRECWRLQGFTDEQFDKAKRAGLSDSQLYKQAGNAVTVNVIGAIGRRLIPILFDDYKNLEAVV